MSPQIAVSTSHAGQMPAPDSGDITKGEAGRRCRGSPGWQAETSITVDLIRRTICHTSNWARRARLATPTLELVQRLPVGLDSSLHLGEGRSYRVIVLLRERCGQMLPEPVEMLADDPADLLVAGGPVPGGRWRPAGRARHVRQRRHPQGLVLVREQPGPGPQVGEEVVEHRIEGVRLGDPSVSLPDVQDRVNDLAEHLVEGGDRVVAPWRAHAGTDARRRPPHAQGEATGSRHPTPRTSCVFAMELLPGQPG